MSFAWNTVFYIFPCFILPLFDRLLKNCACQFFQYFIGGVVTLCVLKLNSFATEKSIKCNLSLFQSEFCIIKNLRY